MKTVQNSKRPTPFTHTYREPIHTQFKNERLESANRLKVEDRSLERLVECAYDGFIWLLERKRKYYCYNAIPISEAAIECNEWKVEITRTIGLNKAEVQIIENLLIASQRLMYRDADKILLMCLEQSQRMFMPDSDTGKAFNEWLEMP